MSPLFWLCLSLASPAEPFPSQEITSDPAKRLVIMKKAMAAIEMRGDGPADDSYRVKTEPALRFTNTVGDSLDGTIFLWLGDGDRPAAAVQVFQIRSGVWHQEWTSLATCPLVTKSDSPPDWRPSRGGVEFKPIPGAPKPAESAAERLRQIHALTGDFKVRDFFRGQSWQPLRLMPKPLARYGKPGSDVTDGALFAFVLTTDPECFLTIEARKGENGVEWQYAFAPMTVYGLEGLCKERVVWSLDFRRSGEPDGTFYNRVFEPRE
jgi:hypothetical protein